jgi:ABC-type multidrug transport system fused ATPase/permease subunit
MMEAYATGAKRAYLSAGAIALFTTIGFSTVLGVLWYGGYLVINDKISIGELSSFILYTINMSTSVLMLGSIMN